MPINLKDEIVQDFLIEAGELLEQLGEQLVDLELRPGDKELLNAVFRSFHTIKGGASFIGLDALVQVCHRAEDVFNLLRQSERTMDTELMDVVLRTLDSVHEMFNSVRRGDDPEPASENLLEALQRIIEGAAPGSPGAPAAEEEKARSDASDDSITDEEFEALLDALEADKQTDGDASGRPVTRSESPVRTLPEPDTITEDEFEALLDQLHGKGRIAGMPGGAAPSAAAREMGRKAESAAEPADLASPAPAGRPRTPRPSENGRAGAAKPARTPAETSVRVDTGVLDHIMNMVGELVLVRNRLAALEGVSADEELAKAVNNLAVVTSDLQAGVMRTRMQPIRRVFGRFPRVVRDLARSLDKSVELRLRGEDTDLDKNLVEALGDPLIHLVRNAVDHGIETPAVREAAGKNHAGEVLLSAEQEGDHILLTIRDDGAGMDADVLRNKAVEKNILDRDAAARMEDKECFNLIFAPGFSTKLEISDVSGRGVGMDVVKTRIAQLNGSVDIDSVLGVGTTIRIKVPLTLAIMPTLMVMLGRQIFAFPLVNVSEIFDLQAGMTHLVDGQLVVRVRGRPLPLFFLEEWLVGQASGETESGRHVVVVQIGTQQVGLVVDQLLGQEEVVIKPLGALLQGIGGLAGATITGDGHIALILDVPSLVEKYARRQRGSSLMPREVA